MQRVIGLPLKHNPTDEGSMRGQVIQDWAIGTLVAMAQRQGAHVMHGKDRKTALDLRCQAVKLGAR
jgi:hypothetical protein